jgi:AraC-like DNA-binding protein
MVSLSGMSRKERKARGPPPVTPAERKKLEAAMWFIARSVRSRPRLADLARVAHMTPFHFHRRFKACFGETPLQAVTRHQIQEAKRLMLAGQALAEVARATGFSHQTHFSSRFKQVTGATPMRWLRDQQQAVRSGASGVG